MSLFLLATKLYIPQPAAKGVDRPSLRQKLNEALAQDHRLILVSAPAGFGKTTLLSQWIRDETRLPATRFGWLSLDEADNDPARFLAYLVAALRHAQEAVSEAALNALRAPQPPPLEAILTMMINEIAETAGPDGPAILVLDDYHVIKSSVIHNAVDFLLDNLPPRKHLVIASRSDPPLHLARRRGRGQLTELRAADLRFAREESFAFLNQVMDLDLSMADVITLDRRIEGWVTGLQLAGLSLQMQPDRIRFLHQFSGSDHYILDYLLEEVLSREPEPIQRFLLETAILDRLTAGLCDAVTGGRDSQALLEQLERANLFIVPLDNERRWYRYHRLFADLLRARVAQDANLPTYHRRAAQWYRAQDLVVEALSHMLQAGDFDDAAALIETRAISLLTRGELTTLLGWLKRLPEMHVHARPRLAIYHAWALALSGQADEAAPWLESAEQRLEAQRQPDEADHLLGHISAIRAYLAAHRQDIPNTIALANQALTQLDENDLIVRSVVAMTLGGTYLISGDVSGAARALAEAARLGRQGGNIHVAVPAICNLAMLQSEQGRPHDAVVAYREALTLATEKGGAHLPVAAAAYSGLGQILYQWNDLPASELNLKQAVELGQRWSNVDALTNDYIDLAHAYCAQGKTEAARETYADAETLVRSGPISSLMREMAPARLARLALALGDVREAETWVSTVESTRSESSLAIDARLVAARLRLAQERPDAALRLLSDPGDPRRLRQHIERQLLIVLARYAQGDAAGAIIPLREALAAAEPAGYVRIFVDAGKPMQVLLTQARRQGISPDYVVRLLAGFEPVAHRETLTPLLAADTDALPEMSIESLSERELEVLRLVAAGRTNREIAESLIIAVSTVKSHTNNIYGKLGTRNRTEAVAQARLLGLL